MLTGRKQTWFTPEGTILLSAPRCLIYQAKLVASAVSKVSLSWGEASVSLKLSEAWHQTAYSFVRSWLKTWCCYYLTLAETKAKCWWMSDPKSKQFDFFFSLRVRGPQGFYLILAICCTFWAWSMVLIVTSQKLPNNVECSLKTLSILWNFSTAWLIQ